MISALAISIFSALYMVACAMEIRRVFQDISNAAATVASRRLTIIAIVIQTAFLASRLVSAIATRGMPLANWSDWCLLASWLLAVAFVLLAEKRPGFGVFLLPLVLALIGLALLMPNDPVFQKAQAARVLGMAHGVGLLLGTVIALLGFSAGLMYLLQAYRLKHKIFGSTRFRLPSLEYLQAANERALVYSSFFLIFGMVMGMILNVAIARRDYVSVPWTDPAIVFSMLLAVWLVSAWLFASFYRPVKHSRKVAYLTVASFVALVMTLAIVLFGPSSHARQDSATLVGLDPSSRGGEHVFAVQKVGHEPQGGLK